MDDKEQEQPIVSREATRGSGTKWSQVKTWLVVAGFVAAVVVVLAFMNR